MRNGSDLSGCDIANECRVSKGKSIGDFVRIIGLVAVLGYMMIILAVWIRVGFRGFDFFTADTLSERDINELIINSNDGYVNIPPGIYILNSIDGSSPIISVPSTIILKGAGIGKTILKMSANSNAIGNFNTITGYPVINNNLFYHDIEISDMTIDGSYYNTGYGLLFRDVNNLYIHDIEFINMQNLFINITNSNYQNNYHHDFTTVSNGVMYQGSKSIFIRNNLFKNMNDDMIAVSELDDSITHKKSQDIIIQNNIGLHSIIGNCFAIYGVNFATISGNICRDAKASGIAVSTILAGNSFGTNDINIIGNIVENVGAFGIQISSGVNEQTAEKSSNFIIANNIINHSASGILISDVNDVLITGNKVFDSWDNIPNRGSGVLVYGDRNPGIVGHSSNIVVQNNILTNNIRYGYANFTGGSGNPAISDIWVELNDLRNNRLGTTGTEVGSGLSTGIIIGSMNRLR